DAGRGPPRPHPGGLRGLQPSGPPGAPLRGPLVIAAEGQRAGPGTISVVAVATAVLVFLIAPVAIIVIVSFSGAGYLTFPPPRLSLRWYERFFGTPDWRRSIVVSVQVASLTMVFATMLGLAAA